MHTRIVTFRLNGPTHDQFHQHATSIAEAFNEWPGLLAKVWLGDIDSGTYGGIYVFDSADAADASRSTPLFQALEANAGFADLLIREYATLDEPTAITAAAIVSVPR